MSSRVLVTGGAGFIGSHLCKELENRGDHVIILDDLSTGNKENIESLLGEKVNFVEGSILDLQLLRQLCQNIDTVFHLAAISSITQSLENPIPIHQTNITGTLNVLISAKENGVRKVVYSSSSSIYGDSPVSPKTEDMLPIPQSPYAAAKLAGEYYCSVFGQLYDISVVSLRYFNVYGPRQPAKSDYAAVVPAFISKAYMGKPPIIYGDGEQTRDLVFVEDVVAANLTAANSSVGGVFNIGTGKNVTINKLAHLILALADKDVKPIHQQPRPGDVLHSTADITKAKRELGWEPKVSLEEGLAKILAKD